MVGHFSIVSHEWVGQKGARPAFEESPPGRVVWWPVAFSLNLCEILHSCSRKSLFAFSLRLGRGSAPNATNFKTAREGTVQIQVLSSEEEMNSD